METLVSFLTELNDTKEFFSQYAKAYWQLFVALTDEGFNERQAIEIIKGFTVKGGE